MKLETVLFLIVPLVLMLTISVGMPVYRLQLMKKAGEKVIPLVQKKNKLTYLASVTAYLVLILSALIDFGKMNFVIPYCAVLAYYICIREGTFNPINGVYENLLIVGSDILKYDDIINLPESTDSNLSENVLVVVTKKRGKRQLTFDNANEVKEVRKFLNKQ